MGNPQGEPTAASAMAPTHWRQRIAAALDDLDSPLGRLVNGAIALLVLLSAGIFVALTYPLPDSVRDWLNAIDNAVLGLFVVEYALRWWCADRKLQYLFSLYAAIDLVAILPFFLAIDTKYLRLLRWFRFLRLVRLVGDRRSFGRFAGADGVLFGQVLFTLFAIVFIFSGLIYQVEHTQNSEHFQTFLDAFYFSIFTMTTVGYGNVTPTTDAGRLLSVLMVLLGIALIPVQLGELLKRLVKASDRVEIPCPTCGLGVHDVDASFCKACGTPLPPA